MGYEGFLQVQDSIPFFEEIEELIGFSPQILYAHLAQSNALVQPCSLGGPAALRFFERLRNGPRPPRSTAGQLDDETGRPAGDYAAHLGGPASGVAAV